MEWATAHFHPCVSNLSGVATEGRVCREPEWCHDRRARVHDVHAYAHDRGLARACGWPGRGCHDRPLGVLCRDREFSVAIEIAHPMS